MDSLVGQKAVAISLPDQNGTMHSLADYTGQYVLLYFYPRDDTPGCTTEACTFRDLAEPFQKAGVQIIGVSADSERSHKKFAEKYQLSYPLLADTKKELISQFGVLKEKSMFGKKYMGIQRDSFLIDQQGIIVMHFAKVDPLTHPSSVLDAVNLL